MTSDRKRRANKGNASRSTGPRTAAGKARSRRNAFRHGLASIDTADPEVAAWIDKVAHIIAGPDANDPVILEAARDIAAAQHQLKRVQQARLTLFSSEAYPRLRHRLRPSYDEKLLMFRALEGKFLENQSANVRPKHPPFAAWPDVAKSILHTVTKQLMDEDTMKQHWLTCVVHELGKIERYEERAFSRRQSAELRFEELKRNRSAGGIKAPESSTG